MNKEININEYDFLNHISDFIVTDKYARYNEQKKRRETWGEIVDRVELMHLNNFSFLPQDKIDKIKWAFDFVRNKELAPSMRSMQFGGKAIEAHNARIYNCSVRHIDSLRSFAECFYLLLCGCGVSFGLSKKYLSRIPNLVSSLDKTGTIITYVVEDTIEGWADSVEALMMCYFKNTPYTGRKIVFDYSKIRAKGTPLKTGGGKAPGYKGLKQSHQKIKEHLDFIIETKGLNRLRSIDAYDILMHCADAVLSGGIRRAATATIFQLDDHDMMASKTSFEVDKVIGFEKNEKGFYEGYVYLKDDPRKVHIVFNKHSKEEFNEWDYKNLKDNKLISWSYIAPWRARSNNSVILRRDKTSYEDFKKIIEYTQQWGEPGFVFANTEDTLLNPCFEVGFEPISDDGICGVQFCNLTTVNGAKVSSKDKFMELAEASAIIGTLQAYYTYFPYLSPVAKELTEGEALLGCSITGMMDNPEILLDKMNLALGAQVIKQTNKEWAELIGIKPAARTTLIKPEGTSSLVFGSGSGIHPHHAHRYFRRIQVNKTDPIFKFFKKHNPHMVEESVWSSTKTDEVITFPVRVSDNAMIKDDLTAIKHLDIIKNVQDAWVNSGKTEFNKKDVSHNVSCTVIVDENEWDEVFKYVYENRFSFAAVSFLPKTGDKQYAQAPLQKVYEDDEEKWKNIIENYKEVDYTKLIEDDDKTSLQDTVACAGGNCEVINDN